MKKSILSLLAFFITITVAAQVDPIIMTIDGKGITKSEFLQIYLKNNNDPKYDKASLDEYMDLFKKFKLKVSEAEALGYDTIPKLNTELKGYQKQLALPYLIDSVKNEALVLEAYDRTKTEVRASHILLKYNAKDESSDTLAVYNKMLEIKKRIEAGESFESVAKQVSEDPSAQTNGGDLGYFTAFQMVYSFEETAYTTPIGSISNPFRTRFGYHILKVTDKRDARGTIETAHIMVAVNRNDEEINQRTAETKANEIYNLLKSGESFESLVTKYSDDPSSNKKGGRLPAFGTGTSTRMVTEFESAAFDLENDGDFSAPVRTDYGYHIIKRIRLNETPSFDQIKKQLEGKVAKDDRAKQTQDSFIKNLKKDYNYKSKSSKGKKVYYNELDTTYFNGGFAASEIKSNKVLFILNKEKFRQSDFTSYLANNFRAARSAKSVKEAVDLQYNNWEKETILNYEESQLPAKYPAFKALITEYHDGILLYEIMSDKVWNKAMRDTSGLKAFYNSNPDNYMWGKRLDADIFECNDKENADLAYKLLQNDTLSITSIIQQVNKETELNTKHRNGKFDVTKTRYIGDRDIKKGLNEVYEFEDKFYVIRVNEILEPSIKDFNDAKGSATSDYQNHLEKEWLNSLAKKHTIVINEEVLYSIGK
jgi:peptidyl-prolyl cis-trans isomerase SurA